LNPFRRRSPEPVLRIGHRGAPALEPENTLGSFEAAARCGVDFIEFDVVGRPDGVLVVAHSVRELVSGGPTLEEALAFFARTPGVGAHVDVKCHGRGAQVAAALERHDLVGRTIASSSRFATLRELRTGAPELSVAITYPDDRFGIARRPIVAPLVVPTVAAMAKALPRRLPRWLAATGSRVAMLHYGVVSAGAIARCHARDVAVWAWTVNDPALGDRLVRLGVDGIVSDDPRIIPAAAGERLLH
jgi:glycerophosphoryl diester phosphodiesterase